MQETQVQSLGQEDPWRRGWLPSPVFLPGEFRGQRNLARYSPCSCKELDMTELDSHFHFFTIGVIHIRMSISTSPLKFFRLTWKHKRNSSNIRKKLASARVRGLWKEQGKGDSDPGSRKASTNTVLCGLSNTL